MRILLEATVRSAGEDRGQIWLRGRDAHHIHWILISPGPHHVNRDRYRRDLGVDVRLRNRARLINGSFDFRRAGQRVAITRRRQSVLTIIPEHAAVPYIERRAGYEA